MNGFTINQNTNGAFYSENYGESQRGKCISLKDKYGMRVAKSTLNDSISIHDENFAFLSTTLAKLHAKVYEPKAYFTYKEDIDINVGGGFVDYVEYYTVDWAGIVAEFRNLVSNNANFIPRVNAGLSQKTAKVFTYEVAYDLRFVELEKAKKLTLAKSIEEIYRNAILVGWDMFVQKIAYTGLNGANGLFNSANVKVQTIDNTGTTGQGFEGLSDDAVVAFFNGIFELYLSESNMNVSIMPNRILVPMFVMTDLVSRFSTLYIQSLLGFIKEHNLGTAQGSKFEVEIVGRPDLNSMGTMSKGRIVAYKKDADFARIDIPYPVQHYITLPNIDKMSYTSAFVGQVSEVQMPYNTSNAEFGPVTYWDFTN